MGKAEEKKENLGNVQKISLEDIDKYKVETSKNVQKDYLNQSLSSKFKENIVVPWKENYYGCRYIVYAVASVIGVSIAAYTLTSKLLNTNESLRKDRRNLEGTVAIVTKEVLDDKKKFIEDKTKEINNLKKKISGSGVISDSVYKPDQVDADKLLETLDNGKFNEYVLRAYHENVIDAVVKNNMTDETRAEFFMEDCLKQCNDFDDQDIRYTEANRVINSVFDNNGKFPNIDRAYINKIITQYKAQKKKIQK